MVSAVIKADAKTHTKGVKTGILETKECPP
jgi:hypothetical protein